MGITRSIARGRGKGTGQPPAVRPGAVWRNAFAPAGLEWQPEHVLVGDQWWRVYAVTAFPPRVQEGWLAHAANLPGVTLALHVRPEAPLELVQALNRRMGAAAGQLANAHDALSQQRLQREVEDLEALMRQIDAEQQAVATVGVYLVVQAPDRETGLRRAKRLEGVLGAAGLRARPLLFGQEEGLRAAGPWGEEPPVLRGDAPPIWPVSTLAASWFWSAGSIDHGHGIVLGHDPDGGVVLLDRWNLDEGAPAVAQGVTNRNWTMLAGSGAGKSHTTKLTMIREWALGARVIVIDPEREYQGLCHRLGGVWIDAGGSGTRINPLQAPPVPDTGEDDPAEARGAVAQHVRRALMVWSLYLQGVTPMQRALLARAMREAYQAAGIGSDTDPATVPPEGWPHIGHVHAIARAQAAADPANDDWRTLAALLQEAAEGAEADLWAGPSTVSVQDADFVVLDVHDLESAPANVRSAQYANILGFAWDLVRQSRRERVLLVVDEAWMLIDPKVPEALDFLKEMSKRIRKYHGALTVVSQNAIDFLDPAVARTGEPVLANASVKLLLRQEAKDLPAVAKLFELTETEQDRLRTAKRGEGLLIAGNARAWVTIDTAPHEWTLLK